MNSIRPQYHFRKTDGGLDAWDVRRLIDLGRELPVKMIDPAQIEELHENHWYFHDSGVPSPLSIIKHMQLIRECDLTYPVILDQRGRVMDGMHRVCKAIIEQVERIPAVQFEIDPEPDHVNCDPQALPYDQA